MCVYGWREGRHEFKERTHGERTCLQRGQGLSIAFFSVMRIMHAPFLIIFSPLECSREGVGFEGDVPSFICARVRITLSYCACSSTYHHSNSLGESGGGRSLAPNRIDRRPTERRWKNTFRECCRREEGPSRSSAAGPASVNRNRLR